MKRLKNLVRSTRERDHGPATPPSTGSIPNNLDRDVTSAAQSLPNSFPDGLKVLYEGDDAEVDICFVHGLTGGRESTWTADGQSASWPATLLPPLLNNTRILTYGYDAFVVRMGVSGGNRVDDHARNLVSDLTTDRELCNAASRPLIFIAHSLGGLVCMRAILRSRNTPERRFRDVFDSLRGLIFLGTPLRGTDWMASWAKISLSVVSSWKSTNKNLFTCCAQATNS
jgi:protein SERAC1